VAIGRDVYNDTRLILAKLETLYPSHRRISFPSSSPEQCALERLLESWAVDGGVFARASQLIPSSMPLLRDPKFTKDREDYTGRSWTKAAVDQGRPEALVEIRRAFEILEDTLLKDGREWVLKTEGPGLGDIEGEWFCYASYILTPLYIYTCCYDALGYSRIRRANVSFLGDSGLAITLAHDPERGAPRVIHLGGAVPQGVRVDRALRQGRPGGGEEGRQAEDG
jgi:hypothetical protein